MSAANRMGAGNYIQAGKAATRNMLNTVAGVRDNAPKYDDIASTGIKARAEEKVTAIRAKNAVAESKIKAEAFVRKTKEKINVDKAIRKGRQGVAKAGVVAAAGELLGDAFKKPGPDPMKPFQTDYTAIDKLMAEQGEKIDQKISDATQMIEDVRNGTYVPKGSSTPIGGSTSSGSSESNTGSSTLTGVRKEFADAIAGPESGSWGYEAFNQGGAEGGTKVLGKSGSHKETFGRSLTDMTLQEIFDKQNMGGSDAEFQAAGGLHAVGRYQFIGSTLQEEVSKMGLDPSTTKFTPEVQDQIFFSHAKRIGNISPWIGPSINYGADKRNYLNSLISQL